MTRRRTALAAVIAAGASLGSVLAIASFYAVQSRGADTLFALWLAAMAFFFGFIVISLVRRVVLGVAHLWARRK